MMKKRGWVRILEATIAVMIVAGVMLVSYSGQVQEEVSIVEYSESLQNEILSEITSRDDLRLNVLNVVDDVLSDNNFVVVNNFVKSKVPTGFGYLLRVCKMGGDNDFCKMRTPTYVATLDKDIFVEETIVSAEVGEGVAPVFEPKKVKIYFWEGGFPEEYCDVECVSEGSVGVFCENNSVVNKTCGNYDNDSCSEYGVGLVIEDCGSLVCSAGACVGAGDGYSKLTCRKKIDNVESGCVSSYDDECDDHAGGAITGVCGFFKESYACWDWDVVISGCELNPVCPVGYVENESEPCVNCANECSVDNYFCSGNNVMKKTCGNYDSDSCLEFDGVGVVSQVCGVGYSCSAGVCVADVVVPKVGSVDLLFSDKVYSWISPNHYYTHTRTFVESGGVGVTFTFGELCYGSTGACTSAVVNYRVEAVGSLIRNNENFHTPSSSDSFTLKYTGIDDNGNSVSVQKVVNVAGTSWISP
ncbi:MAG: hypothetical protein V1888_03145 [archaeon]